MLNAVAPQHDSWLARLQRADLILLGSVGLIVVLGLCFVASAARGLGGGETSLGLLGRQTVFLCMGLSVFAALQRVHYRDILKNAPLFYLICLLLLCGVFLTRPVNGARSWYDLQLFKFQPSELMKPVLILTLAYYLMYRDSYRRLSGLWVPLALALVPLLLILKQPDLGTFLCMAPIVFVMLFAAGAKAWHLGLMVGSGLGAMVLMWFTVLKEYQKRRVYAWLSPEEYSRHEAYQLIRAETAIGSGGVLGKGWGASSAAGINPLPEKHCDFIFAVVAEEGGLLMCLLLLALSLCVVMAGLGIANRTREPAGRLIAVGCVTIFGAQVLINTGVAIGLLPTTGLTYPFVSYGGSSMISAFICLGLLVNIGTQRDVVLSAQDFQ